MLRGFASEKFEGVGVFQQDCQVFWEKVRFSSKIVRFGLENVRFSSKIVRLVRPLCSVGGGVPGRFFLGRRQEEG